MAVNSIYPNLDKECNRRNVSYDDIVSATGRTRKTVYNYLNGITPIRHEDCRSIRDAFFKRMTIDFLFYQEPDEDSSESAD